MTDYKQLCAELVEQLDDALDFTVSGETKRHMKLLTGKARAALGEADEPAVPEGREPASVTEQPSDEELLELWHGSDWYNEGATLREFCSIARAVLARWGRPAPEPLANGTEEQVWPLSVADGCHEAAVSAVTGSPEQQLLATAGNTIDNLWNELEREGWALRRLHRLHQENARFCEPERTILCDILANGTLLPDPDGKRYGVQPVDGEVAESVTWLQEIGETIKPRHLAEHQRYKRAAELLQRQALVPVSVSERLPGPEDCDSHGWCWVLYSAHSTWTLEPPYGQDGMPTGWTHWLPAHALPLPEVGE